MRAGLATAVLATFGGQEHVQAQPTAWPVRSVRLIVPYPPGASSNDILGRVLAQKLGDAFGQQFVADNRPGAGGTLGQELGARATADGYTLTLATNGPMAIGPFTYDKLGYDPIRSYAHVTLFAMVPYLMAAHPSLAAADAREFIALARARPGAFNFASSGSGGTPHLAAELFNSMAGIKLVHVPYKGSPQGISDLIGGQVQVSVQSLPSSIAHIRSGKIKVLGVVNPKRVPALPDAPTIGDTVRGFGATPWYGLFAPAGTPKAIITQLNAEISKALDSKDAQDRLAGVGCEPFKSTPEQFATLVREDLPRWARIVKESGATVD
jgi:tripartite-type tricarboxylate transporter receptor subunit TctC